MSVCQAERRENTAIIDPSEGVNSSTNQWLFESQKDRVMEEDGRARVWGGGERECVYKWKTLKWHRWSDLCPTQTARLIDGLKMV